MTERSIPPPLPPPSRPAARPPDGPSAPPDDEATPLDGPVPDRSRRPMLERIGLATIALVLAGLFGAIAAIALAAGEPFLGVMAAIGCLMTIWVGALTLIRG